MNNLELPMCKVTTVPKILNNFPKETGDTDRFNLRTIFKYDVMLIIYIVWIVLTIFFSF